MAYNNPLDVPILRTSQIDSDDILFVNPTDYTQFSNGFAFKCSNVSTSVALNNQQTLVMCTGLAGAIVLTLPPISSVAPGFTYTIKDMDGTAATYSITLDGDGAETIDGSATFVMSSPFESVTLCNNAAGWSIL